MSLYLHLLVACTANDPRITVDPPALESSVVDTGSAATAGGDSADDSADDSAQDSDSAEDSGTVDPTHWRLFVLRHAEKESEGDDPSLTEEGKARAEALAVRMRHEPLTAIYATDLVRTQETVAPTAAEHGLPVVIDVDPEEELAERVVTTHLGQTLLHSGHSYTIPALFLALGAEAADVDGYGQLWILSGDATGVLTISEEFVGEPEAE